MSQLFRELRRRNVFRVAIAYLAVAWLVLQVADVILDSIPEPEWVMQVLMVFLAIGFPIAVVFAWAYEMTPDGIKREKDVDRQESITARTGRKLNRIIIAVLTIAVVFLLYDKFTGTGVESPDAVTDKSVAVLPFVAMSSGPDDEYFADGLTEEILNSLAQLPELLVTARTSAFHFKGKDIPVPEIAATLGVAHILEGSVRRDGDRMRVTAQLIRADDGFHLWSERYDHGTDSAFEIQADIAEKIAGVMNVVLDESSLKRMRAIGIRNPEAYVALQKGRELYSQAHSGDGQIEKLAAANIWFERVLELAPNYSDAHLLHSDLYAHTLINAATGADIPDEELEAAIARMRADLDAAIETAEDTPRQLNAAFNRGLLLGEWSALPALTAEIAKTQSCVDPPWFDQTTIGYGYEREHYIVEERNVACDPLSYGGWLGMIRSQIWLNEPDAAVETAQRAISLIEHDLLDLNYFKALLAAGRLDEARRTISTVLRTDRNRLHGKVLLAAAIGDQEMVDQAMEEYLAEDVINDEQKVVMFATTGNREMADTIAAEIDARPFGHLLLMQIPADCMCGAPFDIEYTPNFAQLLEDANLPWPPASPAGWPLKDW